MKADKLHPKDLVKRTMDDFRKHAAGKSLLVETEVLTKDKKRTPVSINSAVVDVDGKPCVLAIFRDMSARKHVEEGIHQAATYTRSLIEASLDPLVTIGPDGKITDVNKATENATGKTRKELIGSDFSENFTEPKKAKEGYERVFKKGIVIDYPLEMKHKNGSITSVLYNASVYKDETGKVIGIFAAARDITERKNAEKKVHEKVEELEKFYKMAIGRELRMIELKKEIEKLKKKSEKVK